MKREALYAEFIKEASKRRAEAWSHQAESPEVIAGLYSGVERMRLFSIERSHPPSRAGNPPCDRGVCGPRQNVR